MPTLFPLLLICAGLATCLGAPASKAGQLAGASIRDCPDCPEMVVLPAGSFTMGSPANEKDRSGDEEPLHAVNFTTPFAVGKFEITHAEFDGFVKATARTMEPCFFEPGFQQAGVTSRHPALCLTWADAKAYVEWLALRTGKVYRLPTEAEWEYAARSAIQSGSYPRFSFGDDLKEMCAYANSAETSCDDGFPATAPVGSFSPNSFGLFDIHGNVWEMTEDCLTTNYDNAPDNGSTSVGGDCTKMVIRGGGWSNRAGHLRTANRGWIGRELRDVLTGFRVVRSLD